jgi:hypothetical protein
VQKPGRNHNNTESLRQARSSTRRLASSSLSLLHSLSSLPSQLLLLLSSRLPIQTQKISLTRSFFLLFLFLFLFLSSSPLLHPPPRPLPPTSLLASSFFLLLSCISPTFRLVQVLGSSRQGDSGLVFASPRPCHAHRLRLGRATPIAMSTVSSVPARK